MSDTEQFEAWARGKLAEWPNLAFFMNAYIDDPSVTVGLASMAAGFNVADSLDAGD